jgi:hypothetical protein
MTQQILIKSACTKEIIASLREKALIKLQSILDFHIIFQLFSGVNHNQQVYLATYLV